MPFSNNKAPSRMDERALLIEWTTCRQAYLVASISGAGWGAWISWNCGIGRSLGGFTSLVQQHEAVTHAVAEMARALRMRVMEFMVLG